MTIYEIIIEENYMKKKYERIFKILIENKNQKIRFMNMINKLKEKEIKFNVNYDRCLGVVNINDMIKISKTL